MSSDKKKCEVIDISSILRHKGARYQEDLQLDLNGLIARALKIEQETPQFAKGVTVMNQAEVELVFHRGMLHELNKRNLISSELYVCSGYIAKLLSGMLASPFGRINAFEAIKIHSEKENPYILKSVADSCFLLLSVFPGAGRWRSMDTNYYREMGKGFYHTFYLATNKEIGWHMSQHFDLLCDIATQCILSLKEIES